MTTRFRASDLPLVLVRWYDDAKWLLERVEGFPKSQRFVLGQRLSHQVMEVLEILVEASTTSQKEELLRQANRRVEVVRWTVRMAKDRNLLTASQFEHSAQCLTDCGKMIGGWIKDTVKRKTGADI